MNLRQKKQKCYEEYGMEDADLLAKALMSVVKNEDKVWTFLTEKEMCDYYVDMDSYYELADHVLLNDYLWSSKGAEEEFQEFLNLLKSIVYSQEPLEVREEKAKELLEQEGWVLFKNHNVAICFDFDFYAMFNLNS